MNREHDEMKRIQSELLYKDKREYEDMIRRLENDMQFNMKKFSALEESRILREIAHHKSGIGLLEQFERKKVLYDELRHSSSLRKQELDNAISRIMDLKRQQQSCHETFHTLNREIEVLKNDIAEMTTQKHDYKKQIEDHVKENIIRQQQAKKAIREQHQLEKMKIKADEVLVEMENVQKDYSKLIGYFHKLTTSGSMDCVSPCVETPSRLSAARATSLAQAHSLSVSASSPSFSLSFNQSSPTSSTSSSLLSLSLSTSNNAELASEMSMANAASAALTPGSPSQSKLGACKSSIECSNQQKLAPPNTLGLNFQLQTSSLGESPVYTFKSPIDEFGGCFVMKQKIDDDNSSRKKNWKKSKQKSFKISHPMEVINLLIKMNIPIHLSSQYDECLKLLHKRRDEVSHQLDNYRDQKVVEMKASAALASSSASGGGSSLQSESDDKHSDPSMQPSEPLGSKIDNRSGDKTTGLPAAINNNTTMFPDNNSEISSCLDSNYDSDTSFHHNSNANKTGTTAKFDAKLIETFLSRQSTLTNNNTGHGGGAADADLHAVTDHLLKEQMKINEELGDPERLKKAGSSSRSSSPNTPTNSAAATNEEAVALSPSSAAAAACTAKSIREEEEQASPASEAKSQETLKFSAKDQTAGAGKLLNQSLLLRQFSDGYSSSCSPLSASSINNEQPSVNPFFQDVNQAASDSTPSASDDQATPPILSEKSDLKKTEEAALIPAASILS